MKALFFGASKRQLFGGFHPPDEDAPTRSTAVVLAYPWMAEYNMSHWAFRKLASMLAREGFPTFRFDYFGTGDSMGETSEADVRDWPGDVVTAAREVLEMSGLARVTLVGKGLGATLVTHAANELPTRDLVLWDPVRSGAEYLTELDEVDATQRLLRLYPPAPPAGSRDELLGFSFPRAQRQAMQQLQLRTSPLHLESGVVLVASERRTAYGAIVEALRSANVKARLELAEEQAGSSAAEGQTALLSTRPLQAITTAIVESERA